MSAAWAGGSTRAWRKTRAMVLDRDGHVCQIGGAGCTVVAEQVHHTMGRLVTGDDPRFLAASCRVCNRAVGQPRLDPAPKAMTAW